MMNFQKKHKTMSFLLSVTLLFSLFSVVAHAEEESVPMPTPKISIVNFTPTVIDSTEITNLVVFESVLNFNTLDHNSYYFEDVKFEVYSLTPSENPFKKIVEIASEIRQEQTISDAYLLSLPIDKTYALKLTATIRDEFDADFSISYVRDLDSISLGIPKIEISQPIVTKLENNKATVSVDYDLKNSGELSNAYFMLEQGTYSKKISLGITANRTGTLTATIPNLLSNTEYQLTAVLNNTLRTVYKNNSPNSEMKSFSSDSIKFLTLPKINDTIAQVYDIQSVDLSTSIENVTEDLNVSFDVYRGKIGSGTKINNLSASWNDDTKLFEARVTDLGFKHRDYYFVAQVSNTSGCVSSEAVSVVLPMLKLTNGFMNIYEVSTDGTMVAADLAMNIELPLGGSNHTVTAVFYELDDNSEIVSKQEVSLVGNTQIPTNFVAKSISLKNGFQYKIVFTATSNITADNTVVTDIQTSNIITYYEYGTTNDFIFNFN